jgi:hypothetical protein
MNAGVIMKENDNMICTFDIIEPIEPEDPIANVRHIDPES